MHRFIPPLVLCVVFLATGPSSTVSAKSISERLADGAVAVASVKLKQDPSSDRGHNLLRFALSVDGDKQQALLLQAKLERELPFDVITYPGGTRKYLEFVRKVAEATKSRERKLLLLKVIECIKPDDEQALLELTKAKNQGMTTNFSDLLAAIKSPDSGDNSEEREPESVKNILAETNISYLYVSSRNPVSAFNRLNRATIPRGVKILLKAKKLDATVSHYDSSTGAPYYSSDSRLMRLGPNQGSQSFKNISAATAVVKICKTFGLGYKVEGKNLLIVDSSEDADANELGYFMTARELFRKLSDLDVEELREYRGKNIQITGAVYEIGRHYKGSCVYLYNNRVQVIIDRGVNKGALEDLKKAVRAIDRKYENYSSVPDRRNYIEFTGTAKCTGILQNRIVLEECTDFRWEQEYGTPANNKE